MSKDTAHPPIHTETLVVERRVPEGYSASAAEHKWHAHPDMATADVTGASLAVALEQCDAMLAAVPPRNDYEFRVVLVTKDITGRVISA